MNDTGWIPEAAGAWAILRLVLYFLTGTLPRSACWTVTPAILPPLTSANALNLPCSWNLCLPFCLILSPSDDLPRRVAGALVHRAEHAHLHLQGSELLLVVGVGDVDELAQRADMPRDRAARIDPHLHGAEGFEAHLDHGDE